ncbi:hypothetical protein [Streptomyces sp. NPDC058954]|uniref:hypothetical protein n=1 Tax=Streptomyces sp. NPDC058954 TaxID=3346677 RepID=UPI0036A48105
MAEVDRPVGQDGDFGLGGQCVKLAGQQVTLRFDVFRVLDGDVELSTRARTSDKPIRQFKAVASTRE